MLLPAKLRVPVTPGDGLLVRERLLRQLDSPGSGPALWVCGPPGAGKTVLVQTWWQARRPLGLWYRVDGADRDAALLPHGLRQAAAELLSGPGADLARALPLLQPERQGNLDAFASDFFSPLFDALSMAARTSAAPAPGAPPVLVFDNLDRALDSEPFEQLLAAAVECADSGQVRLVFISRTEPRRRFARLWVHERVTLVGPAQLRATDAEAQALLALRQRQPDRAWTADEAVRLNAWCEGWISGLVLASSTPAGADLPRAAHERAFAYLAPLVLDQQPAAAQQMLLTSALMPTFTAAMAQELSGDAAAGQTLAALASAHLFVSVSARVPAWTADPPVYAFHALLREYLLARGRADWPAAQRQILLRRAGALLLADQQVEAAVQAFIEAQAWDELEQLVLTQAAGMVEVGLQQTLSGWIEQLPASRSASSPWLAYWRGQCAVLFDPPAGCRSLAQAFAGFAAAGERDGQVLAWCSVVEAITLEWRDFASLDTWLEHADRMLRAHPFESLPPALAGRLACAMLSALIWRQSCRADVTLWYDRSRDAVLTIEAEGLRILSGMPVVFYEAIHWGDHRQLDRTYALLRPTPSVDHLAPLEGLAAFVIDAFVAWLRGRNDQAVDFVQRGRSLRQRHGIALPGWMLSCSQVYAHLTDGQVEAAQAALARARAADLDLNRRLDVDNADFLASLVALQAGQVQDALALIRATDEAVADISGPLHWANGAIAEAQMLQHVGDTLAARQRLADALRHQAGARCDIFEFVVYCIHALCDLDSGSDPEVHLRAAFAIGARNDIVNHLWFWPSQVARLCACALARGIERDYALRLIARRRLQAPQVLEAWPWSVRLCRVDSDEPQLWVDGKLVQGPRAGPDAPMRLLLAIVALAGAVAPRPVQGHALPLRPVDRLRLGQHLRRDDHAGTIDDWIHQNLKRLRRRLGHADAVLSWAGKVALNPARVWVDVLDGAGSDRA